MAAGARFGLSSIDARLLMPDCFLRSSGAFV